MQATNKITVGKFKSQAWNGGGAWGAQRYGTLVSNGSKSIFVPANKIFDSNARNKLGKLGAYKSVEDQIGIQAAIESLAGGAS
jgi:hypothetical protein